MGMECMCGPMEIAMKVSGKMIKRMALEFTLITTEVDMKGNGTLTNSMVMA